MKKAFLCQGNLSIPSYVYYDNIRDISREGEFIKGIWMIFVEDHMIV